MTCDILVRSYWKDFGWLQLCLQAITTHCRGFRAIVVVVPRSSEPWLRRFPAFPSSVRLELTHDYRDDYLGQQVTKLGADAYTDAELICHLDSDCIVTRRLEPTDLMVLGKPRVVMRPQQLLDRHWPWRRPTEAFLGWQVTHDFMQQPPFVFPRWLYAELREHSRTVHRMALDDYVLSRPPREFSEFNALGAFAYARHRDRFAFIDSSVTPVDDPGCRWYWSWGGLDDAVREEIELLIGERDASAG